VKEPEAPQEEPSEDLKEPSEKDLSGNFDNIDGVLVVEGKIRWQFSPPSEKWVIFYAHKKDVVKTILEMGDGKQIPYHHWMNQIAEAKVDLKNSTWDPREIYTKMRICQDWINRISLIYSTVSRQYFAADRFGDLLHGVINRTQSEKPVNKQEGLFFEHLRDFELYLSWLKTVFKVSEHTLKTLDGAMGCLSRQVTIALPQKELERSSSPSSPSQPAAENPKSDDFDQLTDSVVDPNQDQGTRSVSWDEIH